jgi:hypothetical protein
MGGNLGNAISAANFVALVFWVSLIASAISVPSFLVGRSQKWLTRLFVSGSVLFAAGLYLHIIVNLYMPSIISLDPSYALRLPGKFFWFAYEVASPIYYTWHLILWLGLATLFARAATRLGAERAETLGGFLQSAAVVLIGIGASYRALEHVATVLNYLGAFAGVMSGALRILLSPKRDRAGLATNET